MMNDSIKADITISIISFNIKYDNRSDKINNWDIRKDEIINLILSESPSFIGIQEGLLNQIQYLKGSFPKYEYIGVGRDDGKLKGEFCAIYYDSSKFQLIRQSTFWLSSNPSEISVGWDAALERICTYGYFEHKNSKQRIWIFNTHFDHIGMVSRMQSSRLILDQINKLNGFSQPTVVMGDFNDLPNSLSIQTLNKKLDDSMYISKSDHIGPAGTFNGFDIENSISKRIDYIFVKRLEVFHHQHLDKRLRNGNHLSDHLPVLIKAKVRN